METLKTDLVTAMKAKDEATKTILRSLIGAVQTAEKSVKNPVEFKDEKVLELLGSEMKTRRDSAKIYADAGATDRAEVETAEADFISRYLPAELTDAEVGAIVADAVAEQGENPNFGMVMKTVTAQTKGRADGKMIAGLVKAILTK